MCPRATLACSEQGALAGDADSPRVALWTGSTLSEHRIRPRYTRCIHELQTHKSAAVGWPALVSTCVGRWLRHDEMAPVDEERRTALGCHTRCCESPREHDVALRSQVRVPSGVLRPGVDHRDALGQAEASDCRAQELRTHDAPVQQPHPSCGTEHRDDKPGDSSATPEVEDLSRAELLASECRDETRCVGDVLGDRGCTEKAQALGVGENAR